MQEFHGDLLIGGIRLKDVLGEIDGELPDGNATECSLSGDLHFRPEQLKQLELHREYRIELENGRAAQVVLSRIEAAFTDEVLADFEPPRRPARASAK
jgi:hypothetical protein